MVLTLARALDVPLRERNQMLLAAGFAPLYRETGLDAEELGQVRAALDSMLAHHEPFPAVVMDRHWNVMMANAPAEAMFAFLLGGEDGGDPPNVVRLMFGPLRPHVRTGSRPARRSSSASTARPWAAFPTPRPCGCSTRCSRSPASRPHGGGRTSAQARCRSCLSSSRAAVSR